jgi:hypothetical protein
MHEARFSDIAEQLLRGGVAPRHVRRTLFELSVHFEDLLQELRARGLSEAEAATEASARLGAEAMVADVLVRPELKSWMRRRPLLAFALLPVAAYVALFVIGLAALLVCVELAEKEAGVSLERSDGLQTLAAAVLPGLAWFLPASVAAACCGIALARRAPLCWPIVGIALISLLGATTNAQLTLPPLVDRPAFGAGLGFSTEAMVLPLFRAGATFLAVLLPYIWLRRAQLRRE